MRSKKIFITGGTGHLGANLIVELLKKNYKIRSLFRKTSNHPFLKNKKFKKSPGDLLDKKSLIKEIKGCDTVIHLAAMISYKKSDFKKLYNINYIGTKNILETAKSANIKKFIFVSSTAAVGYSNNPYYPLTEKAPFLKKYKKISYMYTKHLAEKEVLRYKNRMNVTIFNPSTIIGKGDNHNNTGIVFQNIKNGKIKTATPGGNSFIAVDDVVQAIMISLKNKIKSGEKYILSTINLTFKEYFNIITSIYRKPLIKKALFKSTYYLLYPISILIENIFNLLKKNPPITSELIKISFAFRYFNSSKARKELKWSPKKNIKTAIHEAVKYYNNK